MLRRKIHFSFAVLALMTIFLLAFIFWLRSYHQTTVTFLDVGEGDAIFISQGSNQILIDGGRSGRDLLARLGRRMPFWDRTVEVVIATHPDSDHIGGFVALLSAYNVKTFLYTGAESDTETFSFLWKMLEERSANSAGRKNSPTFAELFARRTFSEIKILKIFRGGSIQFPYGGEFIIEYPMAPLSPAMKKTNAGSIVGRFTYGGTQMLLTGDLPNEETVLSEIPPANILKVAHHGSKYSTSSVFLNLLKPKEAVISVGKNSYGHPSPDVLKRLKERGVIIRRTDMDGDVNYLCTLELAGCVITD